MARSPRSRPVAGQRARARVQGGGPASAVIDPPDAPPAPADLVERPSEPAGTAPRAAAGAGWSGRSRVLMAGLLTLTLAALVALGAVAFRVRAAGQVETARDQAQAAAVDHAVDILSYDYRHLDKDFATGRAALTGKFRGDYAETTSKVIRPTAQQYKAVVKAEVAASSVVSGTADRVVVLLFVNQTTTSTRLDGPKVDLNRVRLTMDRTGGEWLVSDVRAL
jgi:Mce-associated membrane protein